MLRKEFSLYMRQCRPSEPRRCGTEGTWTYFLITVCKELGNRGRYAEHLKRKASSLLQLRLPIVRMWRKSVSPSLMANQHHSQTYRATCNPFYVDIIWVLHA